MSEYKDNPIETTAPFCGEITENMSKTMEQIALEHAFKAVIHGARLNANERGYYTEGFLDGLAYKFGGE
jgi:hypothetical protein